MDWALGWALSRYGQGEGKAGETRGFCWEPPLSTDLGTLTHRCGGQGLAAYKLRWPHAAQEVTELCIRCQANSSIVKAIRRQDETKAFPGAD